MSLYSEIVLDTEVSLAAGAQTVAGTQMNVRVEEEEMLLLLEFQGRLTGVTAELIEMGFTVNSGAGFASPTTLPLLAHTFLTGQLEEAVKFSLCVKLTKGHHVVGLTANPASVNHDIDGDVVHCVFSATRVSSDATLGQGVNSKVQLSL